MYQLILKPLDGNNAPAKLAINASGVGAAETVISTLTAIPSGNNLAVMVATGGNTIQPSSAQLTGLKKYLTLIQSASDTSTVETALAAL
jgi:hypothetical protein